MERWEEFLPPGAEGAGAAEGLGPPKGRSHHPVGEPGPAVLGESQSRCYLV